MPYTPEEIDAIARVVRAEAGSHGPEGQQAVLWTILNRVRDGTFGNGVMGVLRAQNQFEPVMRAGYDISKLPQGDNATIASWLADAEAGKLPDVSRGARYFLNREISAKRGTDFGRDNDDNLTFEYGPPGQRHSFYRSIPERGARRNPAPAGEPAANRPGVRNMATMPERPTQGDEYNPLAPGNKVTSGGENIGDLMSPMKFFQDTPPTTEMELKQRFDEARAWINRPDTQAGLLQFAIAVMQPMPRGQSLLGHALNSIGHAGEAIGRVQGTEEDKRKQALLENERSYKADQDEQDRAFKEREFKERTDISREELRDRREDRTMTQQFRRDELAERTQDRLDQRRTQLVVAAQRQVLEEAKAAMEELQTIDPKKEPERYAAVKARTENIDRRISERIKQLEKHLTRQPYASTPAGPPEVTADEFNRATAKPETRKDLYERAKRGEVVIPRELDAGLRAREAKQRLDAINRTFPNNKDIPEHVIDPKELEEREKAVSAFRTKDRKTAEQFPYLPRAQYETSDPINRLINSIYSDTHGGVVRTREEFQKLPEAERERMSKEILRQLDKAPNDARFFVALKKYPVLVDAARSIPGFEEKLKDQELYLREREAERKRREAAKKKNPVKDALEKKEEEPPTTSESPPAPAAPPFTQKPQRPGKTGME